MTTIGIHKQSHSAPKKTYSRACDVCAIRKIRCQQTRPCSHCVATNIQCTDIRVRKKTGPKTLYKKTLETINKLAIGITTDIASVSVVPKPNTLKVPTDNTSELIPIHHLISFIEIYQKWFYTVFPVQSSKSLAERIHSTLIQPDSNNLVTNSLSKETAPLYCLAASLCACISSKMVNLTNTANLEKTDNLNLDFILNDCSKFTCHEYAQQVIYARTLYNFRANPSTETLLTSFFLYNYHMSTEDGISSAVLYLREAIALAQLMKLDCPSTYFNKDPMEIHLLKKIYYMLFITERFMCIEDSVPVVLDSIIPMPKLENDEFPESLKGFLELVKIFAAPDRSFFDDWTRNSLVHDASNSQSFNSLNDVINSSNSAKYKQAWIVRIQHNLLSNSALSDVLSDSQKVNILVSQFWMRSSVWYLSYQKDLLVTDGDYTLSPKFPITLASQFLQAVESLPLSAFEVHGAGVSFKILEIANSLVEVLLPASSTTSPESDDAMSLVKRDVNDHHRRINKNIYLARTELVSGYKLLSTLFKLVNGLKVKSSSPPNAMKLFNRIEKIINYFNYTGFKNYESPLVSNEIDPLVESNLNITEVQYPTGESVEQLQVANNENSSAIQSKFNLDWRDFFDLDVESYATDGLVVDDSNPDSSVLARTNEPAMSFNLNNSYEAAFSSYPSDANSESHVSHAFNNYYSVFMYPGRDTPILDTIFQSSNHVADRSYKDQVFGPNDS